MFIGIYYVIGIICWVQVNVDFYVGFLGLWLVKCMGGFEDVEQLYLFYGDVFGVFGLLISFLVWEDGVLGCVGYGQVVEIVLVVLFVSIGEWLICVIIVCIFVEGLLWEYGEILLCLKDFDGVIVKLVGIDLFVSVLLFDFIVLIWLWGVMIFLEQFVQMWDFIVCFGYCEQGGCMVLDCDVVDICDVLGFFLGILGIGILDYVVFCVVDVDVLWVMWLVLKDIDVMNVYDWNYFLLFYVCELVGMLLEYVIDVFGFMLDESFMDFGGMLFVLFMENFCVEDLCVMLL